MICNLKIDYIFTALLKIFIVLLRCHIIDEIAWGKSNFVPKKSITQRLQVYLTSLQTVKIKYYKFRHLLKRIASSADGRLKQISKSALLLIFTKSLYCNIMTNVLKNYSFVVQKYTRQTIKRRQNMF
jgi:hypothetical protein